MKKFVLAASLGAAVLGSTLLAALPVQAQGGFGGGSSSQRNSPKRRLTGLVRNIGELEKDKKKPLTKEQAKKVVAAVNPWKAKPKMSDDEAKKLYGTLNTVLTTTQKNELDKMAAQDRRFSSGDRGGGAGGPGGGAGGPGGGAPDPARMAEMRARMAKMAPFMKTYNPFYAPEKYKELKDLPERMRDRFSKGYKSRMEVLAKLAAKAK